MFNLCLVTLNQIGFSDISSSTSLIKKMNNSKCHSHLRFFQEKNLDWFPRMRAMSLLSSEGESEQNEIRLLQERLDTTVALVALLSSQLAELKEQVTYSTTCLRPVQ